MTMYSDTAQQYLQQQQQQQPPPTAQINAPQAMPEQQPIPEQAPQQGQEPLQTGQPPKEEQSGMGGIVKMIAGLFM